MTIVRGGNIPPKEHAKLQVEDTVERILDRLIFAQPIRAKDVRSDCLFMPKEMGPMWILGFSEIDRLLFAPAEDVNHPELVWPVGIGFATPWTDETGFRTIQCNYWQSTPAKVLRGNYRNAGRYNMAWFHGQFIENNQFLSTVEYGTWSSGRWRSSGRIRADQSFLNIHDATSAPVARFVDRGEEDIGIRCALGQSVALTCRYEWGAQFSIPGSPRIIIPTTPAGVLSLFNDRDKPHDRDRRAALRHWVSQHRRQAKRGDFSNVRRYLRGETAFQWRGFDVVIKPSAFDMEQNTHKSEKFERKFENAQTGLPPET